MKINKRQEVIKSLLYRLFVNDFTVTATNAENGYLEFSNNEFGKMYLRIQGYKNQSNYDCVSVSWNAVLAQSGWIQFSDTEQCNEAEIWKGLQSVLEDFRNGKI